MNNVSNTRTLVVVATLIPVVLVNTIFFRVLDVYSGRWASIITVVAFAVVILALRFQARLTAFQTGVMLLLPFAIAALAAWISV